MSVVSTYNVDSCSQDGSQDPVSQDALIAMAFNAMALQLWLGMHDHHNIIDNVQDFGYLSLVRLFIPSYVCEADTKQ